MTEKERGEFAITAGRGPRRVVKIAGQYREEYLRAPNRDDEYALDELLDGVDFSAHRAQGGLSGFGHHIRKQGAPGSGPSTKPEREDRDYQNTGYSDGIQMDGWSQAPEPQGEADLLGQPATRDRREYLDPGDVEQDYRERKNQPDSHTQDDIWSRNFFEDYEQDDLDVEPPILASIQDDPLADLFAGGETFRRRNLG